MKRKMLLTILIASMVIGTTGCGTKFSYVNPVTGESLDQDEQEELQEIHDELSKMDGFDEFEKEVLGDIDGNASIDDSEEEAEESAEATPTDNRTIENYLGKELERGSAMGYEYVIYEAGASVYRLEMENIPTEVKSQDGTTVPVVALGSSSNSSGSFSLFSDEINKSITTFTVPSNIIYIFGRIFEGSNIEEIVIPDTVEAFDGGNAFIRCTNLKKVTMPEQFVVCGKWEKTFEQCESLENVVIPKGVKVMKETFDGCKNLEECVLNEDLESIENIVFRNCESLEYIDIPANVKSVYGNCFSRSGLKEIKLTNPECEVDFKYGNITECPNLETIDLESVSIAETGREERIGDQCPNLKKIVLPKENFKGQTIKLTFSAKYIPNLTELFLPDGMTELKLEGYPEGQLTVYIEESVVDFLSQKYPEVTFVAR